MKRRFRIETGRYGGEIVCGTVSKEFVQYWKDKEESQLSDHLYNLTWGDSEYVDSDSPPTPHEEWSEINDICQTYGAYSDGGFYITEISNEDHWDDIGEEIFADGHLLYQRVGVPFMFAEIEDAAYLEWGEDDLHPILIFHPVEKGRLNAWIFETDGEDFNPLKLVFSTADTPLATVIENVWYDQKLLEATGDCDTVGGKGNYVQVGWIHKPLVEDWEDPASLDLSAEWQELNAYLESLN